MCIEVTNTTDKPVQVIYSQSTDEHETRHRQTIPAKETLTIRYASQVDKQSGVKTKALPDYEEPPPADGPV